MQYFLIGDSHCYEIGQQKNDWQRCAFHGITSKEFNTKYPGPFVADIVVISLGGNDVRFLDLSSNTVTELPLLRSRITAKKVIWFITRNSDKIRELQMNIAKENNDVILDSREFRISPDNIHLTRMGYLDVAQCIEQEATNL
jgi:hypothetical protein